MKKSLLALAVLGAFAGAASAQSSVTLYGTLDVGGKYIKNDGSAKRVSEGTDGIASSELRLSGVEDLGGGLKAGFNIRSGFNPDTGTTNTQFWNRRSTVSLFSNGGELRLGRDYKPDFWNQAIFDAFGANGLGAALNVAQAYPGTRESNSIGYFLPSNLGGFYGQGMVAASEGGTNTDRAGRYIGARLGFAAGPFDVAFSAATQRYDIASGLNAKGDSQKTYNIGGSYDFGFLKLQGFYERDSLAHFKEDRFSPNAIIPMGQGEVHLGYNYSKFRIDATGKSTKVDMFAATYQYNLSKRTAMYGTAAMLKNSDATRLSLPGSITDTPTAGGKSTGFELGVRHFF